MAPAVTVMSTSLRLPIDEPTVTDRVRAVLSLPSDSGLSLHPCPSWRERFYPAPGPGRRPGRG